MTGFVPESPVFSSLQFFPLQGYATRMCFESHENEIYLCNSTPFPRALFSETGMGRLIATITFVTFAAILAACWILLQPPARHKFPNYPMHDLERMARAVGEAYVYVANSDHHHAYGDVPACMENENTHPCVHACMHTCMNTCVTQMLSCRPNFHSLLQAVRAAISSSSKTT